MNYRFLIRSIIPLLLNFCTLYGKEYLDGSSDKSMKPYNRNNNVIESSKLYRKKNTIYYFYSKVKFDKYLSSVKNSSYKKVNIRSKTNIRESDKFWISQRNKYIDEDEGDEDGDMLLQEGFGVSKPKPWRKDDEDSIARNAKAEVKIDPNKPEKFQVENLRQTQSPSSERKFGKFHISNRKPFFSIGGISVETGPNKISMNGCGKTLNTNKRIVNGKNAVPGAYPWVVAILKLGDSWCGGSIINERWVLTAAHCFMHDQKPSLYAIRVGTIDRTIGTTYKAEKVILHERFHLDNMFNSDIALLKVDRQIKMGDLVNGVCLPTQTYEEPQGKNMVVVGWGQTSYENKELPAILQEVLLNRITVDECAKKYQFKGTIIYRSQICTWNKGQDACQGDSGAPAIEWRNQIAFQVGIVSYGSTCADELPGVYTKVSYFINWIANNMKSN